MAESRLSQWNEDANCNYMMTGGLDLDSDTGGGMAEKSFGDKSYSDYTLLRARMADRASWPHHVLSFAKEWEMWKQDHDYCDFEDLIERCRDMKTHANENPSVIYLDEAQDSSSSELALASQWAEHCNLVMIGDPDQAIFEWRGANPKGVSGDGLPDEHVKVLGQSYRVPRSVRDCAINWISAIRDRKPVTYQARPAEGFVERVAFDYKAGITLLKKVVSLRGRGTKSVMVIGSCAFHLAPLVALMRQEGIPFHNPYRLRSGAWNPLAPRKGRSSPDRLRAFLSPATAGRWSVSDLTSWLDVTRADGLLVRNAKSRARNWELDDYEPNDLEVASLFVPGKASEAMSAAWDSDLDWLYRHLLDSKQRAMSYPMRVVKSQGVAALHDTPGITIGTIHSVKGGEADVVILLPDLSNPAHKDWCAGRRDQVTRLMYVGMTRAREGLVLASPASPMSVRW